MHGARANGNVRQLSLFGIRVTGRARPDSDVDIAIALVPASEGTDWALGSYFALHNNWKQELETIVGRHVSLEAIIEARPKIRRCAPLEYSCGRAARTGYETMNSQAWAFG